MASIPSGKEPQLAEDWNVQAQTPGFRIEPVNMLAQPKEVRLRCEITGAPATIQMITPYITLYFGSRHDAELAWAGILYKIAPPKRFAGSVLSSTNCMFTVAL